MIEVAIQIEGQNGLRWTHWQRIAQAVEDLGFVGLYRSDHYTNAQPPDQDSLELWVSLTWLASHTQHIEFGSMVSPVSFRHPTMIARMASAIDDLSNGRLHLGLGAGWQEREHHNYGLAFEMREWGVIIGAASEVVEQLGRLAEAGVQRIMLQWLDLDDIDGLEWLATTVLPQVSP